MTPFFNMLLSVWFDIDWCNFF